MPKILIIDDEPDLRLALTATLEDNGYEVVEGTDGSEALELAIAHSPDLIILDVNMPIVNGITALKILKSDDRTSGIPVCILTAVVDPSNERYAIEFGAEEFFKKPWSEEHMVRRLSEIIAFHSGDFGGEAYTDNCVSSEPLFVTSQRLQMERDGWISDSLQARHNIWVN